MRLFHLLIPLLAIGCGGRDAAVEEPFRPVRSFAVSAYTRQSRDFAALTTADDAVNLAFKISGRVVDIPVAKGAMLIADMIGLPVYHAESGESLGEIADVSDVAGRRIYTVKTERGEVMLPDVAEFIKEISEEGGMRVLPIPGFFDNADEI